MAKLTVINTTAVPNRVRGCPSRHRGLFMGTLSARVRDELWTAVAASVGDGAAILVHPDDTEQRFTLRTAGERRWTPVDDDGIILMALNPAVEDNESISALRQCRSGRCSPRRRW